MAPDHRPPAPPPLYPPLPSPSSGRQPSGPPAPPTVMRYDADASVMEVSTRVAAPPPPVSHLAGDCQRHFASPPAPPHAMTWTTLSRCLPGANVCGAPVKPQVTTMRPGSR